MTEETKQEENKLVVIMNESEMEKTKGQKLLDMFTPYLKRMAEVETRVNALDVKNPSKEVMKEARETRMDLKNNRCDCENARKDMKAGIVREGKLIDSFNGVIKATSQDLEAKCMKVEKFFENQEKAKKEELAKERTKQLFGYEVEASDYNLEEMKQGGFDTLLENSRIGYEEKIRAQKMLEAGKIESDRVAAEERERVRRENERLKLEVEEREKEQAKDKAEADKKIASEKAAREKAEQELKERERIEAEKLAKEKEEAERKEQAPDKEKLLALSVTIENLEFPKIKNKKLCKVLKAAKKHLQGAINVLRNI